MSARLMAEIGADTRGFEAGLNRMDAATERFTHKVSKKLDKAFGIGFLAGLVAHIPAKLTEHIDQIDEGAKKLRITAEQYQMVAAAAKDAGQSVEEFTQAIEKSGSSLLRELPKLEKYRRQVTFSNTDVQDWQNLVWGSKQLAIVAAKPFAFLGRSIPYLYNAGLAALGGLTDFAFGRMGNPELMSTYIARIMERSQGLAYENGQAVPIDPKFKQLAKIRGAMGVIQALQGRDKSFRTQQDQLEDQRIELEREASRNRPGWIWNPDLTERQQAGAFVQHAGIIVSAQEQTNQRLEAIADEARELQRKMEANRDAVEEVRAEIQKLRDGVGG